MTRNTDLTSSFCARSSGKKTISFQMSFEVDISPVQNVNIFLPIFFSSFLNQSLHPLQNNLRLETPSEFRDLLEDYPCFSVSISIFSVFTDVVILLILFLLSSFLRFLCIYFGFSLFLPITTFCSDIQFAFFLFLGL